jgi:hypothetical protein
LVITVPRLDAAPHIELMGESAVLHWGSEVIRIPRLKHGALFLMSGYIGSQLWGCEYKLSLDYLRGRIVNESIVYGLLEHSRQLGVDEEILGLDVGWTPVIINRGEEGAYFFNEKMRNWIGYADFTKPFIQEPSLVMVRSDVPILGLPDLIINVDGKPTYVIELKTTSNPRNIKVVRGRESLQAESYFHMLTYLGLDPRGVAVVKMTRGVDFRIIDNIDVIIKHMENAEGAITLTKHVVMHRIKVRSFNDFLKDVDYALEYWLGFRNPRPNPGRGLCSLCEHRRVCPYSVVR